MSCQFPSLILEQGPPFTRRVLIEGSSANISAMKLRDAASALETAFREEKQAELSALVEEVSAAFGELKELLGR